MPNPKSEKKQPRKRVDFRYHSPDAGGVFLVGDFNGWNEQKHPMKRKNDGFWHKSLTLAPGTYEYKFKVDNDWQNDPENPFTCPNGCGTTNNFFIVEAK